ncbi:MAG: hypothetical protein H6983_19905 [Ectothiorhodospiraceae bacterium]|nr:hypothetical protein [Chromatiales bacterium]MCP5156450.1 hypothetical protein [Ectothiorhodospiraceae bacterium]
MSTSRFDCTRGLGVALVGILALVASLGARAIVLDVAPAYRGAPGSVFAAWDFALDPSPIDPDPAIPDLFDAVRPAGGNVLVGTPALASVSVLPTDPNLILAVFEMPNFTGGWPRSLYRVQTAMPLSVAASVAVTGVDVFAVSGSSGTTDGVVAAAPVVALLPGNIFYYQQDWIVAPSRDLSLVSILYPTVLANSLISVVIDSVVVPEPPIALLLAPALAALVGSARTRRRRIV